VELRGKCVVFRLETYDYSFEVGDSATQALIVVTKARVRSDISHQRFGHNGPSEWSVGSV